MEEYPALIQDASQAMHDCGFRLTPHGWAWQDPFSAVEEWNGPIPSVALGRNHRGRCFFKFKLGEFDSVWLEFRQVSELIVAVNAMLLSIGVSYSFAADKTGGETVLPNVCLPCQYGCCGRGSVQPVSQVLRNYEVRENVIEFSPEHLRTY